MIMAGAGDRLINPQHNSVRLHNELMQSNLRLTAGAGHMAHHLAPEQVMEAINSAEQAAQQRLSASVGASLGYGAIAPHSAI